MNGHRTAPDERVRHLMMAAVDEEISGEERAELDRAMASDSGLRDEMEAFQRLKEVTDTMTPRRPSGETWDRYWEDVYRRIERGVGWVLISLAVIVLGTWGAWQFVHELLVDRSAPAFIRWSVLALVAGLVILFVSVLRERLFMQRSDPYKDIVR